jgi:prepilin-type N-terminal cleavage/methylation domain-containing protein
MFMYKSKLSNRSGFSLLELVMVLTIIAVLIVAAITGTSLINESRLQSVIDDITRYRTAVAAFKLKYNQFPGDFEQAYAYFGASCDTLDTNCNGNGNGRVEEELINLDDNETFRVWQHLTLSEISQGDFTGKGLRTTLPYTRQLPFSRYPDSVYGFFYFTTQFGKSGNALFLGSASNTDYLNASIRTQDASSIDRKMDDGIANEGFVFAITGNSLTGTECSALASSASGANYNVTNNDVSCRMIFWYDKVTG